MVTAPHLRNDLDWLTAAWLRQPAFLSLARQHVRQEHFDPAGELCYLAVFKAVCGLQDVYSTWTDEVVLHASKHVVNWLSLLDFTCA